MRRVAVTLLGLLLLGCAEPGPAVGAEGQVVLVGRWDYPVAESRRAHDVIERAMRDNDLKAIAAVSDEVFLIRHDTRVRVVRRDGRLLLVQVQDGQHAGRSGWLRSDLVRF